MLRIFFIMMVLSTAAAAQPADDSHQWLEDVSGAKAIAWVKARNAETLTVLEASTHFASYRDRALAILEDKHRIAYPTIQANHVTNFWQDEVHVRGIWRQASRQSYLSGAPAWTTVIDLDALGKAEGRNWVWKGADCLAPDYARCLISLSDGGRDSVEVREFDMNSKSFVKGGFFIPDAKQDISWWDSNTLSVGTNWGEGSLTTSGYPRQLKLWHRGTTLASAVPLAETAASSVSISALVAHDKGRHDHMVYEGLNFFSGKLLHVTPDGRKIPSPLPDDADIKGVSAGAVLALLRTGFGGYASGSLVSYAIDPLVGTGKTTLELVYAPGDKASITEVQAAKSVIYIATLDTVTGRLKAATHGSSGWTVKDISMPANGDVTLVSASDTDDMLFAHFAGFTTPDTLYAVGLAAPKVVAALPARFDAGKFEVLQKFAISKDGTSIPYFIIRPKGSTGPLPTWQYGYGGFEVSITPSYVGPAVQFWLEEGNQYVVANIRGGGEFGPAWHQAALKQNRQRAYDDFHAVAEDLISRKLTTAKQLGIDGRSNGGLLMGVAYTQRPDLYHAVLMGVPLADMKRYNHLLAGASWMDEYGNPDDPADWAYISKYSPYQNIKKDVTYPKVFFYTSTKDDRVHPGHARKMAARMMEYGKPFFYYENIEGGHAGVANLKENAYRAALMVSYMNRELKDIDK